MKKMDSDLKIDALVFDLDGTLWDACDAVALGWTQGLAELGIHKSLNREHIASVCGLPTPDCVRNLCPEINEESLKNAIQVLGRFERDSLQKIGGILYPGVFEGLVEMKGKFPLFLVSNCQEWYLQCFFQMHRTADLFTDWECYGRTNKSKEENLKAVAQRNHLMNPLYIGDTEGDLKAAMAAGYDFAFVSYGFGNVVGEKTFLRFSDLVSSCLRDQIRS